MEELREDVPQMPLDLDQLFPAGYMIGLGGSMYYQEHRGWQNPVLQGGRGKAVPEKGGCRVVCPATSGICRDGSFPL